MVYPFVRAASRCECNSSGFNVIPGSTLLVTTTVSPSIWTWSLDRSKGSGSVLSTRVSRPSAADSWCAPFLTSATRDPNAFPSRCRSLTGIMSPASLSYTLSFSREGVRSTIKGAWLSVQINVPSTPDPVFSRTPFPSKGYVSLQRTLSSISSTLDLTLSGD